MYKMYLIQEYPFKIQVTCEKCARKGYIDKQCHTCNGKGIHNKTLKIWKIRNRTYTIDKIDRDFQTDELRYWEDMSCYFKDESRVIHFNIKDAQNECNKRNIQNYGVEFYNQYLKGEK